MSFVNEAYWDRILRVVLGLAILYLGWSGIIGGTLGTLLKFIGFVPLFTGLIGWCPMYSLLKFRTNQS